MQELIVYTQDAPELQQDRIPGWILIGRGKMKMETILNGHRMLIDQLLDRVSKYPGPCSLENDMTEFRRIQTAMVNDRKQFTGVLDFIKESTMEIEKLYDPKSNAHFKVMEERHLAWKKAEAAKQQAEANKNMEIAQLKAHVENQYQAQATRYRMDIRQLIHVAHSSCLKALTPPDQVQAAMDLCVQAASNIRPIPPAPFNNVILTLQELQAIAQTIPQPNWKQIWDELMTEMIEKFSMYAHDLAAADVVIEQNTIDLNHVNAMENQALENTQATNVLVAQGTYLVADKVEIKSKTEIKMNDEDPSFVLKIMSAFVSHFQVCMPLIKAKKYSGITIKQMAAALDVAKVQVAGVEYITTEK